MGTIQLVQLLLFIGCLIGQKYDGFDPNCGIDVEKTLQSVIKCPTTSKENRDAAIRKKCNQIPNNCAIFVYHCLPNSFFNDTYELCSPIRQIVHKRCAEFNIGGFVIQGNRHRKRRCKSCPTYYLSNESYQYSECYDQVMREVEDVNTFQSTTELPTSDSTLADDEAEKTNDNNWIIGVLFGILVCLIVCSVAIGFYIKRRREDNTVRTPSVTFANNNEDPESQPTAAQKFKTKYKYFEELNRKTPFERRRYLSEGDNEEKIPLTPPTKHQSQDYSSDEAQENTPLLDRKNADSSAFEEDFDEVKNRITEFDFKAPVSREDIRQDSHETLTGSDLGRSKRNVRKYSDAVEARVYVRPRRRVKSESEAAASSAQLSNFTEGGNCDKQISFKCLSG